MAQSMLETTLTMLLLDARLRDFVREYRFHKTRNWQFDFAWPGLQVAVECEGGIYTRGRHTRARGFEEDCIKYNAAALDGWMVLRFTRRQITRGYAVKCIRQALDRRRTEWQPEN